MKRSSFSAAGWDEEINLVKEERVKWHNRLGEAGSPFFGLAIGKKHQGMEVMVTFPIMVGANINFYQ